MFYLSAPEDQSLSFGRGEVEIQILEINFRRQVEFLPLGHLRRLLNDEIPVARKVGRPDGNRPFAERPAPPNGTVAPRREARPLDAPPAVLALGLRARQLGLASSARVLWGTRAVRPPVCVEVAAAAVVADVASACRAVAVGDVP